DRDLLAIATAVALREGDRFVELGPGRRGLAFRHMAERKVQERAAAWIEALALLELAARLRIDALVDERLSFLEELRRQRAIRRRRLAERRARHGDNTHREDRAAHVPSLEGGTEAAHEAMLPALGTSVWPGVIVTV